MERIKNYTFYLLAVLSGFWGLFITFCVLKAVINIFEISWKTGLVLFVVLPIGFMLYCIPVVIAWGGIYWLKEYLEEVKNSWEYWFKQIGGFIGCIVLPLVILTLLNMLFFGLLL